MEHEPHSDDKATQIEKAARLLGGARILRHRLGSQREVHDLILRGLPTASVTFLISHVVAISKDEVFEKGIGMSPRTLQRRTEVATKRLSPEQSGRAWKFAAILAKATEVFGSREAAERWLERPAIGLDRKRPIDLLTTNAGAEMVEKFLGRLEYGVYT